MESFFLAETTKYLYLIFDPNNFLHNDGQRARIVDTPKMENAWLDAQAEREAVRKWEDNYDLLTILDHRDTVSPMLLRKVYFLSFIMLLLVFERFFHDF
ncbi:hypothetical protein COOONC_24717 [Cooperia oncophora]